MAEATRDDPLIVLASELEEIIDEHAAIHAGER